MAQRLGRNTGTVTLFLSLPAGAMLLLALAIDANLPLVLFTGGSLLPLPVAPGLRWWLAANGRSRGRPG